MIYEFELVMRGVVEAQECEDPVNHARQSIGLMTGCDTLVPGVLVTAGSLTIGGVSVDIERELEEHRRMNERFCPITAERLQASLTPDRPLGRVADPSPSPSRCASAEQARCEGVS